MKADELQQIAAQPLPWFRDRGSDAATVVSSRIRLARNLHDYAFPGRAGTDDRLAVLNLVYEKAKEIELLQPLAFWRMDDLAEVDRNVFLERRLISRELAKCGAGSGVLVKPDQTASVMINEEDHLRVQSVAAGLQIEQAWRTANGIDDAFGAALSLAFTPGLGYLTACPSNVGTGLRASAMLHLPGLVLSGHMEQVINAVQHLGLAVRGILGEGTEAIGDLFQISNQSTLGESESEILTRLERTVRQIVFHEKSARLRLTRQDKDRVYDYAGRAYGVLRNARILNSEEAVSCLFCLFLALDVGILPETLRPAIRALILMVQPGHLQKQLGMTLSAGERDARRAAIVRQHLSQALGEKL